MFINLASDGRALAITFTYNPTTVEAIKNLPGRVFNTKLKRWEVPVDHIAETLNTLVPLGFTATLPVLERAKDIERNEKIIAAIRNNPATYKGKLPLYDFQKVGAAFLSNMEGSLLGDQPGLGKSIQTIAALEHSVRVLILCPSSLKYSWAAEIDKWGGYTNQVIDGNKKERAEQWKRYYKFTIANYELLLHDAIPDHFDAIVCDEATRISNPKAKTTLALKKLKAKKKIALSGTPVSNSPEDLWSIVDWIKPGYLGSYYSFLDRYCVKEPVFHRIVAYKNMGDLASKVARLMLRRTKEEVLKDFPAKTNKDIVFDLSLEESKLYVGVLKQISEEIKNLQIDLRTLNILPVKMLRLKQMTGHQSIITKIAGQKSSKLEALRDLIEPVVRNNDKVIVFTQFAEMARILLSELNIYQPRIIDGSVSAEDRMKAVNEFNTDPKCGVIVMTEAGGMGLNLQSASYVVHYDLPWSVAKLTQREGRAHRIGQTKPVTVYNLVARNTIDEYCAKILSRKNKLSVELLQDKERLEEFGLSTADIKMILGLK